MLIYADQFLKIPQNISFDPEFEIFLPRETFFFLYEYYSKFLIIL